MACLISIQFVHLLKKIFFPSHTYNFFSLMMMMLMMIMIELQSQRLFFFLFLLLSLPWSTTILCDVLYLHYHSSQDIVTSHPTDFIHSHHSRRPIPFSSVCIHLLNRPRWGFPRSSDNALLHHVSKTISQTMKCTQEWSGSTVSLLLLPYALCMWEGKCVRKLFFTIK